MPSIRHIGKAFLSTLSLRRATLPVGQTEPPVGISIHALLAESDNTGGRKKMKFNNFYPRSPCGERHPQYRHFPQHPQNFYPRSPCGERLMISETVWLIIVFLSTLSLRRATPHKQNKWRYIPYFYPRSPCGERHRCENCE